MTYADARGKIDAGLADTDAFYKSCQDALGDAELQVADRDAQLEDAAAAYAALKADYDAYRLAHPDGPPPPPPPPPTGALIGATVGGNDGGLSVVADLRRCYDLSGSGARAASQRCKSGGVVWANYKGQITDAQLRADLQSLSNLLQSKGQTGLVTYEHEPAIKTPIPPDVYHDGYDQLERIIPEFPLLEPIVCLSGFDGDKDPTIWDRYFRPGHRKFGADHYNTGHQGQGEPFATPAENYGKLVAYAKSKGKPLWIGETGVGTDAVAGPVIKTRADWYAAHRTYVLDSANGIGGASAFDSGLGRLDAASARKWYGV